MIGIIIEEGALPPEAMEALEGMMDMRRLNEALSKANLVRALAASMIALTKGDTARMVAECAELLERAPAVGTDLTPERMAERIVKIAALPKSVNITPEGDFWCADILHPDGWARLDIGKQAREGLAKAYAAKYGTKAQNAPTTPTPQ